MRLYAQLPFRRTRQVVGDLLTLAWLAASAAVGILVGRAVWSVGDRLRTAGDETGTAAGQLRGSADSVAGVPLVGGSVATPLRSLAGSLDQLRNGLTGDTAALHRAGVTYGIALVVLGAAVPVLAWCLTRGRWIRRSGIVRGPLSEDDLEALAHQAIAHAGLRTLRRLPPDTVRAWTAGDPHARRALAALQLARLGMRSTIPSTPG